MPEYRFDEIAILRNEKRPPVPEDKYMYVGLEHLDSGKLEVTRWGSEVDIKGEKLVMHKGDILFGRRNTYLKRAAIAPHDGLFSAHGMIFKPNTKVISERLFPFFIASDYFMDAAIRISVGSLSPTVNWKTLRELKFKLPPLEQQNELADLMQAANDTKVAYEQMLLQLDELVKSQFIEMFDASSGTVPLKKCCAKIYGGGTPSMKHPEYYGGNIPFVKSGDVKADRISEGSLWLSQNAIENANARLVPAGSVIVVVRSAALQHEFHAAIVEKPIVINQDIKAFIPKEDILPEYLLWAIKSREDSLLDSVLTMLTSHIETKILLDLPVKKANKQAQCQWKAFLEQTDKSKFELKQAIERVTNLMKSLMQQDFAN